MQEDWKISTSVFHATVEIDLDTTYNLQV